MSIQHCCFCGWEGDDENRVCPQCNEYKGLLEGREEDRDRRDRFEKWYEKNANRIDGFDQDDLGESPDC
jgi:hypothetical protein